MTLRGYKAYVLHVVSALGQNCSCSSRSACMAVGPIYIGTIYIGPIYINAVRAFGALFCAGLGNFVYRIHQTTQS